jgi:hypothetical protein
MKNCRQKQKGKGGSGNMRRTLTVLIAAGLVCSATSSALARGRTGVIEKKKVDGEKIEIFTDTVYGYTLTTPANWDFKVQKEKSNDEYNPFRLLVQNKDKQVPTQLWDSPSAVVNAHVYIFVLDVDLPVDDMRDSLASPTAEGEWQKPIAKNCELLHNSTFLNKAEVRWDKWRGAAFSV